MSREDILNNFISLLRQNRCRLANVTDQTRIADLEMNSIGLTAVLMDLEDFFKVLVPDQKWEQWQNIGDIISYIEKYLEEVERSLKPIDLEIAAKSKSEESVPEPHTRRNRG